MRKKNRLFRTTETIALVSICIYLTGVGLKLAGQEKALSIFVMLGLAVLAILSFWVARQRAEEDGE